ncbi:MAG: diaminopimelate epimerase [Chloroflexota bacterium]
MIDKLPFAKFEGAGNDFVIIDGRPGAPADGNDLSALAVAMCDRHYGIGADGLLVASPVTATARSEGALAHMRMHNPDGSESEMCGNGLRCFARWLAEAGLLPSDDAVIETGAGLLRATLRPDGFVSATMGVPRVDEHALALRPAVLEQSATRVSMGNPHAVFFVPDVSAVPLSDIGPRIEHHAAFPSRTNVEFVQVLTENRLRVRVWERGAGATLACGTGACAAHVAARVQGIVSERTTLELPGGELEVTWAGGESQAQLAGPAVRVFDGAWPLHPNNRARSG